MTNQIIKKLLPVRQKLKNEKPLIHCITNPISINDCANGILAVGAKPIMAEHPGEAAEITAMSGALALNLGNITDARMESMLIAGKTANQRGIPLIVDMVGVACSSLRLEYTKNFLGQIHPNVIKGNMSEIKAVASLYMEDDRVKNSAKGIDVGDYDRLTDQNLENGIRILEFLSKKLETVVLASGEKDLAVSGSDAYLVQNGCEAMSYVTGTGCLLNVLAAAFMPVTDSMSAVLMALLLLGVCGETADISRGIGTYHIELLNQLYTMTDEILLEKGRIEKLC